MALNLSTLTNPATSGGILAEALTTADFLDPVPILKNLARGSQKGGDAKQTTALNQPKALPLDANGKGYCYLPVTTGNAPAVNFPTIGASDDFVLEMKVYIVETNGCYLVTGGNSASRFFVTDSLFLFSSTTSAALSSALSEGPSTIRIERTSGSISLYQNNVLKSTPTADSATYSFTHLSFNGQFSSGIPPLNGYIQTCTLSIGGTEQLNIDFTATNVRHGDTKFRCATGQIVTINQDSSSSNDVATIIKKPVLRFDGADDFMKGVFGQTINGGYMFMAFSVLGNGGDPSGRVFSINSTGITDSGSRSAIFSNTEGTRTNLQSFYNGTPLNIQSNLFDDSNGNILHEALIKNGSQKGGVNNANFLNSTLSTTIESEEFNISCNPTAVSARNTAIDLEYLALFPATITDAQADSVRNYINKRNNVFDNDPNLLEFEPAAAYSLRSFDANADPNVVNVRRSSDNATSDFKASEVSDGTLTSWVNTEYDLVTPTLNNGGFEGGLTGWSTGGAVLDTSVAYAGNNSARFDIVAGGYKELTKPVLEIGKQYKVTFYAKVSDSSAKVRADFGSGTLNTVNFSSTAWEYKEITGVASGSTSFRFARDGGSPVSDFTVNFDNVKLTQLTADGHVTTWYDQSSNGRDSEQLTASSQPKIVSGGTLVTDGAGNAAIVGDGVDDTLVHPTLTNELDSSDFFITAAYENEVALGITGAVPRLYLTSSSMSYNTLGTVPYTTQSGRNVISFEVSGSTQEVFGNGTSLGTASETQIDLGQSMFNVLQGGSTFSDGPLMEVIVYNKAISTADRLSFENGINKYYNIF
jgi:hypothetical protein